MKSRKLTTEATHPAPLVPGEVDLTDFDFMPFDVRRLIQSEFWIEAMATDTRVAAASVNLWAVAWHQIPAASLPNSDATLARYAMVDYATWLDIRDAVLAPWVFASDGRWYHPVVAEKALESWSKMRDREAKQRAFQKRQRDRANTRWDRERAGAGHASRNAGGNANKKESDKEGESDSGNVPSSTELSGSGAANALDVRIGRRVYPADFEAWWGRYPVKKGKADAYRAFIVARREIGIGGLHKGFDSYMAYRQDRGDTPHPRAASWLIGRRWEDGT